MDKLCLWIGFFLLMMFLMLVVIVLLFQTSNCWHDQEQDKIVPAMSMTLIINSSFSSSTVPEDWRTTLITPVFKNATIQKGSDQFPSQMSSAASARFSHIVISSIMQSDSIIIAPEQHGFRCGCSCETQLLGLITKISELAHDFQAGKLVDLVGWTSPRPASQDVPLWDHR